MDLKPIKTKRDYQAALRRAEQLWHAAAGSTEADALDVLTLLIADYETRHFRIADPDPIQFLEYVMESRVRPPMRRRADAGRARLARPRTPGSYQDSLPWQELAQLRLVAFQPMLASSSLIPLSWVPGFTVVEL